MEFAIKLPGQEADTVWLPDRRQVPHAETYQRLAAAAERGDAEAVETCARELETVVRACAKTFSGKYLAPPRTTDFGILFLATEGLYAEALRRPGLAESLQGDYRVVIAGPTTFAALLNSLQMGFRTLAIQQRSGEVWKLLGDVKTQFGKYSQVLDSHPQAPRPGYADGGRRRHPNPRHRTQTEERGNQRRRRGGRSDSVGQRRLKRALQDTLYCRIKRLIHPMPRRINRHRGPRRLHPILLPDHRRAHFRHAAILARPHHRQQAPRHSAEPSCDASVTTGLSKTSASICRQNGLFAPPPEARTDSTGTPSPSTISRQSFWL